MEIFSNTLIKLIVRQGANSDRQVVTLASGEPGYTTDTKRLFIGTGLPGGTLVGNLFKGSGSDVTVFSPSEVGDFAFDTDKNKLRRVESNDGSLLSDWETVGGVYSAGDSIINISDFNAVSLNPLSANNISSDAVSAPLIVSSGRIGLSATIPFQHVSTNTMLITGGLVATANGTSVTGTVFNPLSANVAIQSNDLYAKYNGLSAGGMLYSKNITSVTRLSAGDYLFNYPTLPTVDILPIVQIYGIDYLECQPRVISTSTTACNVYILSSNLVKVDANVYIRITY